MSLLFTKAKELMEKDVYHQHASSLQEEKNSSKAIKNFSSFFKRKTKK